MILFCISICFADFGLNKVEVKSKTANGVKFTTKGSHNHETGRLGGDLCTEFKYEDYGKQSNNIFKQQQVTATLCGQFWAWSFQRWNVFQFILQVRIFQCPMNLIVMEIMLTAPTYMAHTTNNLCSY